MDNQAIKLRIEVKQVESLYNNSYTIAVSHPFAGALLCWLFRNEVEHILLITWLIVHSTVALARIPVFLRFKQRQDAVLNISKWHNLFIILAIIQGALYGFFWVAFGAFSIPEYALLVTLVVFGICSSAAIGYASSFRVFLMFSFPLVIPCLVMLALHPSSLNHAIILAILLYSAVTLKTVRPVNKQFVSALRLNERLAQEIEVREKVEAKLRRLSLLDGLTGLANRRAFDQHFLQELKRSARQNSELTLVLIDVDHFKLFNDEYGHVEGDKCLQELASCMQSHFQRSGEMVARLGGEEFAVIIPSVSLNEIQESINHLQQKIAQLSIPHKHNEASPHRLVTVSIGVVHLIASNPLDPKKIIHQADVALYQAKQAGRNRCEVFGQNT
ncbi:MAG: hypothetical protein Alis3KO_16960 [Aliiglaciecola sp.]